LGCRAAPGWLRYRDGGPTFADCSDIELGIAVANTWHASRVADEVAGGVVVPVPAADAGQLVMGLAMAVAQMVGEACDKLPNSAGEPLDALCKLGEACVQPRSQDPFYRRK